MPHRYTLNQMVRLAPGAPMARPSTDGLYEVVRLMPADVAGVNSYRLRSAAGERVALEHDLAADETVAG